MVEEGERAPAGCAGVLKAQVLRDLGVYMAQGHAATLPHDEQPLVIRRMDRQELLHRCIDFKAAQAALLTSREQESGSPASAARKIVFEAYASSLSSMGLSM